MRKNEKKQSKPRNESRKGSEIKPRNNIAELKNPSKWKVCSTDFDLVECLRENEEIIAELYKNAVKEGFEYPMPLLQDGQVLMAPTRFLMKILRDAKAEKLVSDLEQMTPPKITTKGNYGFRHLPILFRRGRYFSLLAWPLKFPVMTRTYKIKPPSKKRSVRPTTEGQSDATNTKL